VRLKGDETRRLRQHQFSTRERDIAAAFPVVLLQENAV
jgi:hypothetical protein